MKIAVITSSRADWNSTGMMVKALRVDPAFEVSVIVIAASGPAFAAIKAAMNEDSAITGDITWFSLNLTKDDPVNLANAAGEACRLVGEALYALKPDLVVIPGDRWEIAPVAAAVAMAGIPIAHLGGGDRTHGSIDDRWRNVITQLATIHFATNKDAFDRLKHNRLGHESARWLAHTGSPSVDRIFATELMTAEECARDFGVTPFMLVNWQPETAAKDPNAGLFAILQALGSAVGAIFIGQNDEVGSSEAYNITNGFCCRDRSLSKQISSVVPKVYLSLLKHCICLIGNSSSGIYEAPYLGTPVINVGQRQMGRVRGQSVYQADSAKEIEALLRSPLRKAIYMRPDYYGDGRACERIVQTLREFKRERRL